jgi:glycosyltransferase involved in cell wall biosynthesis
MTICLSMIVKNEAHCIEKCLESVKPFIDYWIICDTGSTDNTEEVIRKCLDGIPGEIHNHDWEDFSTNRNKALKLAKDKADYTFIIDADDQLIAQSNPFQNLNALSYKILFNHGSIQYYRTQLIHNSVNCKYVGVLHEYLEIPLGIEAKTLLDCHIFYGASGSRSKNPDKYLHDAEVFEKALAKDPNNTRNVFYCAQSFRDSNRLTKALTYYIKRSEMGGWHEEIYVSLLEAAKLTERIRPFDSQTVEAAYLKAFNFYTKRAEALYYLSVYCRARKFFDKAYFFARIGATISKPAEGLFLEVACYDWQLADELAISSYYVGRKEESKIINTNLLKRSDLSQIDRDRITKNLQF